MEASEPAVPRYAMRIKALKAPRDEIETETEEMADALHLHILTSMPGIGVKTASQILLNNGLATISTTAFMMSKQ